MCFKLKSQTNVNVYLQTIVTLRYMYITNHMPFTVSIQDGVRFKHIAELYSELLAIDTEGRLHSWAWSSSTPSKKRHPREAELLLENEKIKLISAKILRASVVTESGKVGHLLLPAIVSSCTCMAILSSYDIPITVHVIVLGVAYRQIVGYMMGLGRHRVSL